jgi:hypothetical protein
VGNADRISAEKQQNAQGESRESAHVIDSTTLDAASKSRVFSVPSVLRPLR